MSAPVDLEQTLVRYLLGDLPPEEQAQVEERLFLEDELYEELGATADDLIHAYLAGALSAEDRVRFEVHFMASPRRRERLAFVRDLVAAVKRVSPRGSGEMRAARSVQALGHWRPWAVAASLVLASAAAALLLRPTPRGVEQVSASPKPAFTPTATPTAPDRARQSPLATPRHEDSKPASPALRHTEDPVRVVRVAWANVGEPVEVPLSSATRHVRLEVAVEEDGPPSYDAFIHTAGGGEVWREEGITLSASGEPLVLTVPARLLVADAYTLSVEGETLRGEQDWKPMKLRLSLRVVRER